MADFNYSFSRPSQEVIIPKFDHYKHRLNVIPELSVFYNDNTITHITKDEDSITILGYIYRFENNVETYLSDLLLNFNEDRIADIKKEILGQYIAIIHKKEKIYIFSDFLQVRKIFYNAEDKVVCSSFAALNPKKTNDYKVFEYFAMRQCIYSGWLGTATIDDKIKRIRPFEFLTIDESTGNITVNELQFTIDNRKAKSLKEIKSSTLSLLRKVIQHPSYQNSNVYTTITGGFDSRLITSLITEYYPNFNLRISTYKGEKSLDYKIASKISKILSKPLNVYETDFKKQKEEYYTMTEGLMPRENGIMTQLLKQAGDFELGFGGGFGTELYTTADSDTKENLIDLYMNWVKSAIIAPDSYFVHFKEALEKEIEEVEKHYLLKEYDFRDIMRILRLTVTSFFSSPINTSYNIQGRQFEVFGTFPIIEAGLKIPYEYLGSKYTFGRFYMIPKALVEKINPRISKILTTHFCPMRPLSLCSLPSYVIGKFQAKKYYKNQAKKQSGRDNLLIYKTDTIEYNSSYWFEGFMQTYLK